MATESYLVTGGCGLQGSHIVEKLLAQYPGAPVAVMARNPTVNLFPGVAYHRGDITVADDIAQALSAARPTVVFHCAALMTVGRAALPDSVVRAVNEGGTRLLLEHCARAGVRAFVYTSSASVVQKDYFRDIVGGDESMPLVEYSDSAGIYPKSKAAGERLVLAADTPGAMRTCSLRPAAIYGERDNDLTPGVMRNLRLGRTGIRVGDNSNRFSYTYAGNAADAHLLAAARLLLPRLGAEGVAGEAFFVTDGGSVPFWDFPRAMMLAAGDTTKEEDIRYVPRWQAWLAAWAMEWAAWLRRQKPGMTREMVRITCMNRYYDISKARERLGYVPAVEWKDGAKRAVQWYLENEKKTAE